VRRRGRAYLLGLLPRAERKNSWQLAEFADDASPDGMQRLRDEAIADLRSGLELLIEEVGIPDELTLTLNVA
jgi:hypothetical protein